MSSKSVKKSKNHKPSSKKTIKKKKQPSNKIVIPFLFIFLFALMTTVASYFLIFSKDSSDKSIKEPLSIMEKPLPQTPKKNEKFPKYEFEEITKEFDVDYEAHPKVEAKTEKKEIDIDIDKEKSIQPIKEEKIIEKVKEKEKVEEKVIATTSKPKLAIIIDDITTSYQIKKANEIGYVVNLAFLPPTKMHPYSAKLAQNVPNHMIHLPLEASINFKKQEKGVLNTSDSYETIEERIKTLRELYPNVIYTNNHTGSVFTQDDKAMDKLYKALKKYNFIFVDSRTSPKSVAKKYAIKYNMPFYVRNTFIDNNKDKVYIKNQLLKAVKIAKKNGFAIAIGHPYKETFEVLKNSKEILNDIEPVFVHQL